MFDERQAGYKMNEQVNKESSSWESGQSQNGSNWRNTDFEVRLIQENLRS